MDSTVQVLQLLEIVLFGPEENGERKKENDDNNSTFVSLPSLLFSLIFSCFPESFHFKAGPSLRLF